MFRLSEWILYHWGEAPQNDIKNTCLHAFMKWHVFFAP